MHALTAFCHERGGVLAHEPIEPGPGTEKGEAEAHWRIAYSLHHVKDVSVGEDQSLIHQGHGPTIMALPREAVVSLLHRAGIRQISARLRYHSQHPAAAVALLLAPPPADA